MSSDPTTDSPFDSSSRSLDALPPAWSSMWQLCKLGYTHEPRLVVAVVALTLLAAVPDALFALWLAVLGGALLAGDATLVFWMVGAMAVSATLTWLLGVLSTRLTRRFRDRVTIALESHVARLQASVVGLEHQERSDYLDRLAVLRNQVFVLDHMYMSLLSTVGWIVRVGVTVVLLAGISPLLILLVVFAVPPVLSSAWRPAVERAVEERYARHSRLAEHLFGLGTSPAAGKEVRVTGIGPRARAAPAHRVEPLVRPGVRPAGSRRRTHLRLGDLRRRVRRRRRLRGPRLGRRAGRGVADPRRRRPAVDVRRRHHRRDRLPPRHLDGRVPPAGLAAELRRRPARADRRRRTGSAQPGHPAGLRVVLATRAPTGSPWPRSA